MNIIKKINLTVIIATMAFCLTMPCCYAENTADVLVPKTKVEKQTEVNSVLSLFFKSTKFVLLSLILIIAALFIYKKLTSDRADERYQDNIEKDLNSPETIDDAIKFVIEKF